MFISKPIRGTQLNKAHPLSKGLVGCWLFNEVGNYFVNLITKDIINIPINGLWQRDSFGFYGTGVISSLYDKELNSLSIFFIYNQKSTTSPNDQGIVTSKSEADWGNNTGWSVNIRNADQGIILFKVGTSTTGVLTDTYNLYGVNSFGCVWESGVQQRIYQNGSELVYTDYAVNGAITKSNDPIRIGTYYSGASNYSLNAYNGLNLLYVYSDRILKLAEIQALHVNPYQIFETKSPALFDLSGLSLEIQTSWNIQAQQAYNIAWNLLTSVDHATAWNIINTLLTVTSWNIKTSNVYESAWNILVSLESNTAWNLLTSFEQQIAWNILTDLLTDTAWNIITGDKILKIAQRMIYNFDTTRRVYSFDTTRRILK